MANPLKLKRLLLILLIVAGSGLALGANLWRQQRLAAEETLTLYGNIEIRDARLVFPEQELISELLVEEGDQVTQGQLLARIRSQRLHDQINQAKAEVQAQQEVVNKLEAGSRPQEIAQIRAQISATGIRLANARTTLERLEKTAGVGASSLQTRDNAKAIVAEEEAGLTELQNKLDLALEGPRREDIAQAKALLTANQAQLSLLETRLADTELHAPTAGIIQSRLLEVGELAGPGQPVFILALSTPKWARCYIPEPQLGLVREGMSATIISDTWPDRHFQGQVGFISSVAEFTPQNVETSDLRTKLVYEVRIITTDPDNELRLGMPVTVSFPEASARNTPTP